MITNLDPVYACPRCHAELSPDKACTACATKFLERGGIVDFAPGLGEDPWQLHFDARAEAPEDIPECSDHANQTTFLSMQNALHDLLGTLKKGAKILEAGCGSGLLVEPWIQGHTVFGIDFSVPNLMRAQKRGLRVARATVTDLPFRDQAFDAVLSLGTAQYLLSIDRLLEESCRVLKPDGILVLATLNSASVIRKLRYAFKPSARQSVERLYSTKEVVDGFSREGLKLERVSYHFFPLGIYQLTRTPRQFFEPLATNMIVAGSKRQLGHS